MNFMTFRDGDHLCILERRGRSAVAATMVVFALAGLAGCSLNDGVSSYVVDPARYSVYHCKDFRPRLAQLTEREQQLRELMDRASEGGGGVVIGDLSYGPEYQQVIGEEKLLRRAAAGKNCDLNPPAYQSDQIIR
jgi:hypothetical protein